MLWAVMATQVLNGIQFGMLLFLLAAGLTVVFSIMNFINLAHGSFYMIAAYVGAYVQARFGYGAAVLSALVVAAGCGWLVERTVVQKFYARSHMDQVLVTFGLVLFFNEAVRIFWGSAPVFSNVPSGLEGAVSFFGVGFPKYRIAILLLGVLVAGALYLVITHTRFGVVLRAGAWNTTMVEALGVDIRVTFRIVFVLGAFLAGLAGVAAGPIFSVQSGMGEAILALTFVVIVIGGFGSIKGAFFGSLLVGVVDTMGRVLLPPLFSLFLSPVNANAAGPAAAAMLIYALMAVILVARPQGLFPVGRRQN